MSKEDQKNGIVVIGDIVGYSKYISKDQRKLVTHLWEFLNDREELGDTHPCKAILNGTGDGALIAFPNIQSIQWDQVVNLAEAWVMHMTRCEVEKIQLHDSLQTPRLRIGIHHGTFQIIDVARLGKVATHGGKQVVGAAPNVCARITSIGDGHDIHVTQEFVNGWTENENTFSKWKFDPPTSQDAYVALVKHGKDIHIRRVYKGEKPGVLSKRLQRSGLVSAHLIESLKLIEEILVDTLNQELEFSQTSKKQRVTVKTLSMRGSIWVPDNTVRELTHTPYRYHHSNHQMPRSRTTYSIAGKGQGPPGICFRENKPIVLNNLPAWPESQQTHQDYENILLRSTFLPPLVTRQFSRKARSFIVFPFGLDPQEPEGVVCLDMKHPLAEISPKALTSLADGLAQAFSVSIASLWNLRRHA